MKRLAAIVSVAALGGCAVVHGIQAKPQTMCNADQFSIASPGDGAIVAIPHLGGLHHRYERRAA